MKNTIIFLTIIFLSAAVNAQLKSNNFQTENKKPNFEKSSISETKNESVNLPAYIELNELGIKKARDKDYQQASEYFSKALEEYPECDTCLYNLGRSYIKLEKLDDAIEIFHQLIKNKTNYADVYSSLGEVLTLKGNFKESLIFYESALKINPNEAATLHNYAFSLHNVGEFKKAIEVLEKTIKIQPDLAEAYGNLGFTLLTVGRFKDALKSLQKAYELKPNIAEFNNDLGVVLDHFGKNKQAIKHFQTAVKLKPEYAQAQYNLACSFIKIGKRDEAYAILKLLEKNNFELAQQLQKAIWRKYVIDASKQ